jgi:hypothetical protein
MKVLGVVLIGLGALGLYFRSIPYTSKEKVLELGPISATAETEKEIAIPPALSGVVLGVGVLLLLVPSRRRR